MTLNSFKLERYFAKYEFKAPYLLCSSDCESLELKELLSKKEMNELKQLRLGYTESQGNPELRKEISKMFQKIKADNIAVCAPEEGIFVAMNVLLKKGDEVIVQYPCYQSLFEIAKNIGCKIIKWMPEEQENKWRWNIDFLKKNASLKTKLIVTNNPHNPTGFMFSKKAFKEMMQIARQKKCYVFSDEMYRLLEYDKKDMLPAGSDIYEKCVSLSGMSKTFGLAGLRLGWISSQDKNLLKKFVSFKDYTTICSSALSEFAAMCALRKKKKIISRNMKIIKKNLKMLDIFFAKYKNLFGWIRPAAGSISFVKIKFNENAYDFCEDVVKKAGVMLLPSTEYDYGNKHFRIGFGRKNMQEALNRFERYIEKNKAHLHR